MRYDLDVISWTVKNTVDVSFSNPMHRSNCNSILIYACFSVDLLCKCTSKTIAFEMFKRGSTLNGHLETIRQNGESHKSEILIVCYGGSSDYYYARMIRARAEKRGFNLYIIINIIQLVYSHYLHFSCVQWNSNGGWLVSDSNQIATNPKSIQNTLQYIYSTHTQTQITFRFPRSYHSHFCFSFS